MGRGLYLIALRGSICLGYIHRGVNAGMRSGDSISVASPRILENIFVLTCKSRP